MPGPLLVLPLMAACFVSWSGWSSAFCVCVWDAWKREAVVGLSLPPSALHSASPVLQEPGELPRLT